MKGVRHARKRPPRTHELPTGENDPGATRRAPARDEEGPGATRPEASIDGDQTVAADRREQPGAPRKTPPSGGDLVGCQAPVRLRGQKRRLAVPSAPPANGTTASPQCPDLPTPGRVPTSGGRSKKIAAARANTRDDVFFVRSMTPAQAGREADPRSRVDPPGRPPALAER